MATKTKKQSFIEEALNQLCDGAIQFGFGKVEQDDFEALASQLLKESFKNGLKAAYRKRAKESKKKTAEYQTDK